MLGRARQPARVQHRLERARQLRRRAHGLSPARRAARLDGRRAGVRADRVRVVRHGRVLRQVAARRRRRAIRRRRVLQRRAASDRPQRRRARMGRRRRDCAVGRRGPVRATAACSEASFASMRAWVRFVHHANPGLLWLEERSHDLGDWLNIDADTDKDLIATAFFAWSTRLTARAADVLGYAERRRRSSAPWPTRSPRHSATRSCSGDGALKSGTQTAYALALRFGLVPAELVDAAVGASRRRRRAAQRPHHHRLPRRRPRLTRAVGGRAPATSRSACCTKTRSRRGCTGRQRRDHDLGTVGRLDRRTRLAGPGDELVQPLRVRRGRRVADRNRCGHRARRLRPAAEIVIAPQLEPVTDVGKGPYAHAARDSRRGVATRQRRRSDPRRRSSSWDNGDGLHSRRDRTRSSRFRSPRTFRHLQMNLNRRSLMASRPRRAVARNGRRGRGTRRTASSTCRPASRAPTCWPIAPVPPGSTAREQRRPHSRAPPAPARAEAAERPPACAPARRAGRPASGNPSAGFTGPGVTATEIKIGITLVADGHDLGRRHRRARRLRRHPRPGQRPSSTTSTRTAASRAARSCPSFTPSTSPAPVSPTASPSRRRARRGPRTTASSPRSTRRSLASRCSCAWPAAAFLASTIGMPVDAGRVQQVPRLLVRGYGGAAITLDHLAEKR